MRFVRALRTLMYSIMHTLKSLVWAALLVWLVIYFFGILFTQAVGDFLRFSNGRSEGDSVDEVALEQYWGTLPRSMFTLFKVMTNGVDWDSVVHPLSSVHAIWVMVFTLFVAFVHFALLNAITGVFCQSAMEGAQYDKELMVHELLSNKQLYADKTRDLFRSMFATMDAEGLGTVTMEAFQRNLSDQAVCAYFALLELDTSDAFTLFKLLDADGSSVIDADEFVEGCLKLKGQARSIDLIKLTYEMRWMTKQLSSFIAYSESQFASLRAPPHR